MVTIQLQVYICVLNFSYNEHIRISNSHLTVSLSHNKKYLNIKCLIVAKSIDTFNLVNTCQFTQAIKYVFQFETNELVKPQAISEIGCEIFFVGIQKDHFLLLDVLLVFFSLLVITLKNVRFSIIFIKPKLFYRITIIYGNDAFA